MQQNKQTTQNCHSEILAQLTRGNASVIKLLYDLGLINHATFRRARGIVLANALYYIQYRSIPSFKERMQAIATDLGLPYDTVINYLWRGGRKFRELMIKTYKPFDHRRFHPRKNQQ